MYPVGTILAGKYRIERVIGEGGMGMVVAATHLHLGTQVALKFMHQQLATNQQLAERFYREARASALLKSEHVCRVSDVGILDDGAPYIVMELLTGQDLGSMLHVHGPMPAHIAAEYVLQSLAAIAEAHTLGIIHRDLKPGNLFSTQRPDGSTLIKVLDFGIAKAPDSVSFSLTQTASAIGSPGYMSPEQLKSSKEVDPRSDIWSLGIVLYELVSGRLPFVGESITELALRVAMDPTPALPMSSPYPFQVVVARCLEKDPARRYQDVAELAMGLAQLVGPQGLEIANAVTRVLRGHQPRAASATPSGANDDRLTTVAPRGPLGAPTPVPGAARTPVPGAARTSQPTTLGAATGSIATNRARHRFALFGAIVALSAVGVVIGVVLASEDTVDDSHRASQPAKSAEPHVREPPPPPPAVIDAPPPSPPPIAVPADAGVDPAPASTPVDAGTPKRKRSKKQREDVGESRE